MKRFFIITNETKDPGQETTRQIEDLIREKGGICVAEVKEADCILVLGGDGTLIRAAREYHREEIPFLGINMGTLGYLAEVELQNVEEAIDQLLTEETMVESRMMLRGSLNDGIEDVALNDIVITRQGALRVIRLHVYVNGELINTYHADGVIVSTPTGSTGYSMSAGGPIVEPTASMIVITPICSHALNNRSIVLSAEDEIVLEIGEGREAQVEEAAVSFDGDRNIEVRTGDRIRIHKADETTKLLKLSCVNFLETLRRKMKGN